MYMQISTANSFCLASHGSLQSVRTNFILYSFSSQKYFSKLYKKCLKQGVISGNYIQLIYFFPCGKAAVQIVQLIFQSLTVSSTHVILLLDVILFLLISAVAEIIVAMFF